MTEAEKLILLMLADIHTHLRVKSEIDAAFVRDAIIEGQLWALSEKHRMVFAARAHKSDAEVNEVYEVLDMWWLLEPAYAELNAADRARVDEANHGPVQLQGFDGHEDQLGIARWIVERMGGEFQRIKDRVIDCHCNVRAEYAAMLRAFKPLRAKLNYGQAGLTADDIISVVTAPRREHEAREAAAQAIAATDPTEPSPDGQVKH